MGDKVVLSSIPQPIPSHVEGHRHWVAGPAVTEPSFIVKVIISYWEEDTHLKLTKVAVDKYTVERAGGTPAEWIAFLVLAQNSSDTDDVVEELAESDWGKQVLWGRWRAEQAQ